MPILMDSTMEELKTSSNYKFSAVKVDELGATEYTLVTIVQDVSGSVCDYKASMEDCLKTVLQSCSNSARKENLMLRLVAFNNSLTEVHGFRLLDTIKADDYTNSLNPNGGTALFDAVRSAVEATKDYAEILMAQDYSANAIIFVVTDGMDNCSAASASSVEKAISDAMKAECLEGITVVLVGVNDGDQYVGNYLQNFQQDANITQFVDIGSVTPKQLAKLANFISQSISSTSQSLANGTSSNLLTF